MPPEKKGELSVVPAAVEPSAWALPIFSVPPVICVMPLYVLAPFRESVPVWSAKSAFLMMPN